MMESFDDYCERKGIKPGEEPVAFAAYLAENGAPDVSGPHPICSCENDPDVCSVHGTREERSSGIKHEHDASCAFGNPQCPEFAAPTPVYFSDPRGGSFVLDENGDPIGPALLLFALTPLLKKWMHGKA